MKSKSISREKKILSIVHYSKNKRYKQLSTFPDAKKVPKNATTSSRMNFLCRFSPAIKEINGKNKISNVFTSVAMLKRATQMLAKQTCFWNVADIHFSWRCFGMVAWMLCGVFLDFFNIILLNVYDELWIRLSQFLVPNPSSCISRFMLYYWLKECSEFENIASRIIIIIKEINTNFSLSQRTDGIQK